ncbi:hypothetical protein V6N13_058832 [Hibiscus sabdariffa]|uniref:Uncharacterized protein n=1 Tax=Hibiscus sabdariffa TaxID=183260 RepID=A0ABR2GEX4_9ROSI
MLLFEQQIRTRARVLRKMTMCNCSNVIGGSQISWSWLLSLMPRFFESENLDDAASAINDYTKFQSNSFCHFAFHNIEQDVKRKEKTFFFLLLSDPRSVIILLLQWKWATANKVFAGGENQMEGLKQDGFELIVSTWQTCTGKDPPLVSDNRSYFMFGGENQ